MQEKDFEYYRKLANNMILDKFESYYPIRHTLTKNALVQAAEEVIAESRDLRIIRAANEFREVLLFLIKGPASR